MRSKDRNGNARRLADCNRRHPIGSCAWRITCTGIRGCRQSCDVFLLCVVDDRLFPLHGIDYVNFYRLVFFKISPDALVPPYWINMGALAITTLAGSILCINIPKVQGPYADFLGFTKGFTLFFWSFGTWWIPFLVIMGIWKYVFNKTQYKYTPLYWGMVFPLGMYTACTIRLSQALKLPFIANISNYFIYAAYVAWSFIFITMILSMIKAATAKEAATPAKEGATPVKLARVGTKMR